METLKDEEKEKAFWFGLDLILLALIFYAILNYAAGNLWFLFACIIGIGLLLGFGYLIGNGILKRG